MHTTFQQEDETFQRINSHYFTQGPHYLWSIAHYIVSSFKDVYLELLNSYSTRRAS